MYNFFVEDDCITDTRIQIKGENYNHIKNVLRMKIDEKIQICNKQTGESFLTKISEINSEQIECTIIKRLDTTEPKHKITIFQGIPKSDKMEYIIQKSVELGVFEIIPVEMKYCVAKIKNPEKKINRWNAISESAAKQSKRTIIPNIGYPVNMKELCVKIKDFDQVILAYENEENYTIKQELQNNKNVKNIAVIIGPEGGVCEDEVHKLINAGAKCVSLGKRILRTETASSLILSMIMYENEL